MKRLLILTLLTVGWLTTESQPLCSVTKYDEANGVSSPHVTQLLQDERGFMWFATWNGLCRYDGYEFQTFKPAVGDGCHMPTDRIRNISLLPGHQILCQVDDDYYMFDLRSYRFRDLTAKERQQAPELMYKHRQSRSLLRGQDMTWTDNYQTQWTLHNDGTLTYWHPDTQQDVVYPLPVTFNTLTFGMKDQQGNFWVLDFANIYKFCTDQQRTKRLDIQPKGDVKCLFADSQGHYFVATKGDGVLRIYNRSDDRLLGYVGADGHIHPNYTRLGAAVYCMHETKDGTLWLGTKPNGLYRLRPMGASSYKIDHFTDIPAPDVYHITEDAFGRLWIAMLGGGVVYTDNASEEHPNFLAPKQYPKDKGQRVRYIYITKDNVWLAATGSGLMVARQERDADRMTFRLHQRDSKRASCLSCSATMDIVQDSRGQLFVSTESGGVNQIVSTDLLAKDLDFHHFKDELQAESNDIVQSLSVLDNNQLMAVGSHLVTLYGGKAHNRVLDARCFQGEYRFSEAHPLALGNDRWLFGLTDGAFLTTMEKMTTSSAMPKMVFTSVSIQGGDSNYAVEMADSIVLQPNERSLTVRFATLEYSAPERISYSFRLLPDKSENFIGHDRTATLLDLEPGTYQLEVRSTNADGEWQPYAHHLTIVVQPTFWESTLGRLTMLLITIAILAIIIYTLLYIRRIKLKQHEMLEAYLALLEDSKKQEFYDMSGANNSLTATQPVTELDPMLQRVMKFIEENLSNSDATVGDMAQAAATSRSGLQRKLKQTMGITPQDLLREARIKRACQLLGKADKNVADIAYACGFTDPKYFSRCFRQSTGQTPTDYRNGMKQHNPR